MTSVRLCNPRTLVRSALLLALAFGIVHAAACPARAFDDGLNLLSGGFSAGNAVSVIFTSPGLSNAYGSDFPSPGAGEDAAQIRVAKGTFSNLRVSLKDRNQTSGSVTVTVRINGVSTAVGCTVDVIGNCKSPPGATASASTNDRLAIRVDNDLVGEDGLLLTYSLVYD